MSPEAKLIQALDQIARDGEHPLDRRMADLAVWFHSKRQEISIDNLAARQALTEKAFWILLEIIALQTDRIKETTNSKSLWLPRGMKVSNSREYA